MKKILFSAVACFSLFSFSAAASAITVDGNLSDWGITPFVDWNSDVGTSLPHDGIKPAYAMNWGDDRNYDIEVGAVAMDNQGMYVAMVISDANLWEDLAIAVNGSANYRFGVSLNGLLSGADGAVQNRGVYNVTQWDTEHIGFVFPNDPFQIVSGDYLGQSQFVFHNLALSDPGEPDGSNFAIEGFVSWSVLGILPPDMIGFHFAEISCLRDAIRVDTSKAVPEPATMLLLSSGLAGAALRRRRRG